MDKNTLSDEELLRYSRHIMLPQLDVAGQLAICRGHVLILGLGGLGSPAAIYLAAAGVGELTLVDDDVVDQTNLQRQIIHSEARVGEAKVVSAQKHLQAINHRTTTHAIAQRLNKAALADAVKAADVVLDCTDNFVSRQLCNKVCVDQSVPLVSGAAIRFEAQLSVFDFRDGDSPCYQCLYDITGGEALTCSESGVISPLVGLLGSYQALEALKLLSGCGQPLVGRVQLFDGLAGKWREFTLRKDPECLVCGAARR